jgi:hypothetical protein
VARDSRPDAGVSGRAHGQERAIVTNPRTGADGLVGHQLHRQKLVHAHEGDALELALRRCTRSEERRGSPTCQARSLNVGGRSWRRRLRTVC